MLKDKTALITGSTSGIGLGIARRLAGAGAHVMLHGLGDQEKIERTRRELADATGVNVCYDNSDIRDPVQARALVRATQDALGSLDILVNNAGIQHVAEIGAFPPERWTAVQDIVLNASFHTISLAIPSMKQRDWGRIVNVASVHGLVASPFKSAYVAAKHGVIGLTKTVALELAETAITCNAICPGYVHTSLVEGQIENQAKSHGLPREQVVRDIILAAQPSRRFVQVEEIAELVLFLCGDHARSVTGASIPIDGGWTAR